MSARSNLEEVLVSLIIMAADNFSVDGVDVTVPVVELVSMEVSIIEIGLIRAAILTSVGVKGVVILVEDELCVSFEIFDFFVSAGVEIAQIVAELMVNEVDLAEDVIMDDSNS